MKAVHPEEDDLYLGKLIRTESPSWTGPSPHVQQSRWAGGAKGGRRIGSAIKMTAASLAFAALVFGSVMVIASGAAPDGRSIMTGVVSHVFWRGAAPPPNDTHAAPAEVSTPARPLPSSGASTLPMSGPGSKRAPSWNGREMETPQTLQSPQPPHSPTPRPSGSPGE